MISKKKEKEKKRKEKSCGKKRGTRYAFVAQTCVVQNTCKIHYFSGTWRGEERRGEAIQSSEEVQVR